MSKGREKNNQAESLKLQVGPVADRAEKLVSHVEENLPQHQGLAKAARGVSAAARTAERVSIRLRRSFGIHRLPAFFLLFAIVLFLGWIYWQFIHTSNLRIAVSARDAVQLKTNVDDRVRFVPIETEGSRESIRLMENGDADLAFVQGGVGIPDEFLNTKLEASELVLFFVRERIKEFSEIRTVMTSSKGQGSHSLALVFAETWSIANEVAFVHQWRTFTDDPNYQIAKEIDAIFVVKDPMSKKIAGTASRLKNAGFKLMTPDIGAMQLRLPYLAEANIRTGFLDPIKHLPTESIPTYSVATYLVARQSLTPREMAAANKLLSSRSERFEGATEPTLNDAGEVAQGVEAVLGIFIYIGVAFIALLGIEMSTYRRHFNELNSLISLISMHQSSKDAIGLDYETRMNNISYLSVCSDLLGLISVITGYYAQENASLLYSRLLEIIHDRCDGLKINIQLKILHGLTELNHLPVPKSTTDVTSPDAFSPDAFLPDEDQPVED